MRSRDRVELALNYQEPDHPPLDLGGNPLCGIHVSVVYRLRQALKLDQPGMPVKVVEPHQMLGEVTPDLADALGSDVVGLTRPTTIFGFRKEGWKPWTTFDGTPVLVPAGFNTDPESNGDILLYPQGDKSAPPSGRMRKGGSYFEAIIRRPAEDGVDWRVEDNLEEFGPLSDDELEHLGREAERLYMETDKAIFADFGGLSFGDTALMPGLGLKCPKGIRDFETWYMALTRCRDLVRELFDRQCNIALGNLARIYQVVGDRVTVVLASATDFGMQTGLMISPRTYRELYKPFHRRLNDWIHQHTKWKTFIHSCGSIAPLVGDFVEAGFDILNPLQCSASGMEPSALKKRFGGQLAFWGGVDGEYVLPFGAPDEVRKEVNNKMAALGPHGGYIVSPTSSIEPHTPVPNILAMVDAVRNT